MGHDDDQGVDASTDAVALREAATTLELTIARCRLVRAALEVDPAGGEDAAQLGDRLEHEVSAARRQLRSTLFAAEQLEGRDAALDHAPATTLSSVASLAVDAWCDTDRERVRALVGRGSRRSTGAGPGASPTSIAEVLATFVTTMTLLVVTPAALVLRRAWLAPGGAVVAAGHSDDSATAVVNRDVLPDRFAVLTGIPPSDPTTAPPTPRGWETVVDRVVIEALLSTDPTARARSIDVLRTRLTGDAATAGPWRAWSAGVVGHRDGALDAASIVVVDTPSGSFFAVPWADSATLLPADAATLRAALQGLADW